MSNKFNDDFKHFDNLIWKLPSWSTAIFVLSITGLTFITKLDLKSLHLELTQDEFTFLFLCLFFQMTIFNALVRFRHHQVCSWSKEDLVFIKWFYSGQFWLQMAVILQSATLFFLAFTVIGIQNVILYTISLIILMLLYSTISVRFEKK